MQKILLSVFNLFVLYILFLLVGIVLSIPRRNFHDQNGSLNDIKQQFLQSSGHENDVEDYDRKAAPKRSAVLPECDLSWTGPNPKCTDLSAMDEIIVVNTRSPNCKF